MILQSLRHGIGALGELPLSGLEQRRRLSYFRRRSLSLPVTPGPGRRPAGSCYAQEESDQFRDEPAGGGRSYGSGPSAEPGRPLPYRGDAGAAVRRSRGAVQNPAPLPGQHRGRRRGVGAEAMAARERSTIQITPSFACSWRPGPGDAHARPPAPPVSLLDP